MSSQSPYRAPEGTQNQDQPQVDTSLDGRHYPPPQSSTGIQQQPAYTAQQPYPPIQPQSAMYYPAPQYVSPQYVTIVKTNGLAIASLVLGILGVLTCWNPLTFFVGLPLSVMGIILAVYGMRLINGKGMAIAGLVLSIIGVVISGMWAFLLIIGLVVGSQ